MSHWMILQPDFGLQLQRDAVRPLRFFRLLPSHALATERSSSPTIIRRYLPPPSLHGHARWLRKGLVMISENLLTVASLLLYLPRFCMLVCFEFPCFWCMAGCLVCMAFWLDADLGFRLRLEQFDGFWFEYCLDSLFGFEAGLERLMHVAGYGVLVKGSNRFKLQGLALLCFLFGGWTCYVFFFVLEAELCFKCYGL
ncbi:unnamed protein product [Vicia faba]|uniref:Transmembrane protein n=1 Tax=Vicia faba TaxID=3906 RepID=A0AAV1AA79_VICFA|nr:unnamed protein product [Vicia faba]